MTPKYLAQTDQIDQTLQPARTGRTSTDVAPTRRWRLGRRTRRTTLVVHIVSAGAWIGIDVIVAVLVATGTLGGDAATRGLAYQALARFVTWPMLASGLVCLASGVLLGLGTPYGLVRYCWVAVKLVLNVVLCVLVVVSLQPGMPEVAEYGRALAEGAEPVGDVSTLAYPPVVSLTTLSFATLLAVFKPWGRIRKPA
jgi:uncharacterized membrane protein